MDESYREGAGASPERPEPGEETSVRKFIREVFQFAVFFRNAEDRALRGFGLTSMQFMSLYQLWRVGEMTVSELIRKTVSTPGNMTVVLRNLEKSGYISKKPNPEDGRSYLVRLTERGQKLVGQVRPEYYRYFSERLIGFSDEDVENFCSFLVEFNRRQDLLEHDPAPSPGGKDTTS